MQRWLWRHPATVCIGSLWLLAAIAVVVIDACLPDSPPSNGCMLGPDCVQNPRSQFEWAAVCGGGGLAALALGLVGAALSLLLEKPFRRRAERLAAGGRPGW